MGDRGLVARVPGIELREDWSRDTFKHLLGEDTEQLPADVQRFEYGAVLVVTLWRILSYINDLSDELLTRVGH